MSGPGQSSILQMLSSKFEYLKKKAVAYFEGDGIGSKTYWKIFI